MISTSASVMASRSSQWTMAREQPSSSAQSPRDGDLRDIDVPVLMRGERLHKAGAFQRGLRLPAIEPPGALEHPVGTRGAHRYDVAIKHHESKPVIALQRKLMVEVDDRILLPLLEPVITGN